MKQALGTFCVVSAMLLANASCKNNSETTTTAGADLKTLDNFAAGKNVRINECKGTEANLVPESRIVLNSKIFQGSDGAAKVAEYKGYVKEYLTSVPKDLQRAFNALDGEILITDKAAELCGKSFSDSNSSQYVAPERRAIESCFIYATNADQTKSWFTVVHAPDAKAIRHGGIRVFGSIYAQFIPRLAANADKSSPRKFILQENETLEFSNYKQRISAKFLSDLNSRGVYDLNNLKSLLGDNVKATVSVNLKKGADPLEGLVVKYGSEAPVTDAAKLAVIRKRFDDFVFAEAFDSFRCSGKTAAVMKDEFPATHAEYVTLDRNILAAAKAVADQLESTVVGGSLALSTERGDTAPSANLQGQGMGDLLSMLAPLLSGIGAQGNRPTTTDANGTVVDSGSSGPSAGQIISQIPFSQLFQAFNNTGASLAGCGCQGGNCSCSGGCCGGCSCSSGGGCSCASGGCSCCGGMG